MIFSKKIYKIVSGKNLSIFAEDEYLLTLFIFDNITNKYSANINENMKTTLTKTNLSYNQITKLNNTHSCLCYDKNLTIIENEKQNI